MLRMLDGQHEPWTNAVRFNQSTRMSKHRYADRFSIVRVETTEPIADCGPRPRDLAVYVIVMTARKRARPLVIRA